jgi:hypothetical protein
MTALLSSSKPSLEQPAQMASSARPDTLWQRMINSWIHTYELCSSSGTVPFLLL